MKPLDWLNRSKSFLKSAKINIEIGNFEVAAFEIHQAIELALKAVHIHKYGSRPYTNNLVELAKAVDFKGEELDFITLMYTYSRYPEAPLEIPENKIKVMFDVAKRAIEFAEQELEKEP